MVAVTPFRGSSLANLALETKSIKQRDRALDQAEARTEVLDRNSTAANERQAMTLTLGLMQLPYERFEQLKPMIQQSPLFDDEDKKVLLGLTAESFPEAQANINKVFKPEMFEDAQGNTSLMSPQVMSDGSTQLVPFENPEGRTFSGITPQEKANIQVQADREKDRNATLRERADTGLSIADGSAILKRGLTLLDTVETGGIEAARLRMKQAFGVEGADEGELSANLGKAILSQLRDVFGAQFTEREGARLEQIEASFGKSTETNKRLLNQALRIVDRKAERGIRAAEELEDFDTADEIRDALEFSLELDSPTQANPKVIEFDAEGNRAN